MSAADRDQVPRPFVLGERIFMRRPACLDHSTAAPVIMVEVGTPGYWPIWSDVDPARINPEGITLAHQAAALVGSMFGWCVPGADPAKALVGLIDDSARGQS